MLFSMNNLRLTTEPQTFVNAFFINHVMLYGRAWLFVMLVFSLVGCSESVENVFDKYEIVQADNKQIEYFVGKFMIPIPDTRSFGAAGEVNRNFMQVDFELYVLITPDTEATIHAIWQQHEGKIRYKIIQVCRNSKQLDFIEQDLLTIKAKLVDVVRDYLGPKPIYRLVITDLSGQQLM